MASLPRLADAAVRLLLVAVATLAASAPARADYFHAHSYFRQGKFQRTLEELDTIKTPPPELMLMRAECLQSLDRLPDALAACRDLTRRFPKSSYAVRAQQKELDLLDRLRDFPGLVVALERALAQDPALDSPFARDLAMAHVKSGQPARAIEALEKRPSARNIGVLANIAKEAGLLASYLGERERVFDKSPDRARLLGLLYFAAQNWTKAEQFLALAPRTEETLSKRLEAARARVDRPAQITFYQQLIALAPAKGPYYERLGELYLAQGDTPRALATWKQILETQGKSQESYAWLARVLLDHGFKAAALDQLFAARQTFADATLFHKEVAECHAALGNFEMACQEYLDMAPASFDAVKEPLVALARTSDAAYTACAARLASAVAAAPRMPEYYLLADEVLRIRGFSIEIQKLLDSMCRVFQDVPRELLGFAEAFASGGRLDEAHRLLAFVALNSKEAELFEALLAKAALEKRTGAPIDALATLDTFETSNPPAGFAARGRALRGEILLSDLGRPAEARPIFDALVAANPASTDRPLWLLAASRAALGTLDFASARQLLSGLTESPHGEARVNALYVMGYVERIEGRFDEAMEHFTTITMDDTGGKVANDALEAILFLSSHPLPKDEQPALRQYFLLEHCLSMGLMERYEREAVGVDPARIPPALAPDFMMLSARAQRRRGQFEDCVQTLSALMEKHADSTRVPEALLMLADVHEADRRSPEKAAKALKDYLMANPASLRLDEIRERIQRLGMPRS